MRALTLCEPWAYAITHFGKDVENRTWAPPTWLHGQRFAIHAGRSYDDQGHVWIYYERKRLGIPPEFHWPSLKRVCDRGRIVAVATLGAIATTREGAGGSPWFQGPVGWLLRDVVVLAEPITCRGFQGLWRLPAEVSTQLGVFA